MQCLNRSLISTSTGLAIAAALTLTSVTGANAAPGEIPSEHTPTAVAVEVGTSATEERAVPILAIIGAVLVAGGTAQTMGTEAAKKVYYAGLRNPEYQSMKWTVRAAAVAAIGPVLGGIFMVSFENQFYSML